MLLLLLSCAVIMLASLSGKIFIWRSAGEFIERNLHLMVTFAAGVFLVFAWQLSREVFEHMEPVQGILWIAAGALAVSAICRLFPHEDGEHADHQHRHGDLDAHRMLVSDSIHNAGDGILLAATFSLGPVVGLVSALGVLLHEVVQEIAEFFVLRDAGYSVNRALLLNFATSSTILIGAIGGYAVLEVFESFEGPLLAVATGGVLSVIFFDLLPHSYRHARKASAYGKHALWIALGAILMFGVTVFVPHEHPGHSEEAAAYVSAVHRA